MAEPPLLEVKDLRKSFGALAASDGLSFKVAQGTVHGLIGPNGAGKTTAISQIFGETKPDGGQILFDGRDITRWATTRRVRSGLQRSYQITSVFDAFTVIDNVSLAVQAASRSNTPFWSPARLDRRLTEPAQALVARLGLADFADREARELSHGQRRQLELAIVLAGAPRLLLLDEPMAGLGPTETEAMTAILRDVAKGVTILLVEHDMDVVFALAERITVLAKGRALADGSPEEIRADPAVREAYLGDHA
ncbi:MAG: ABC transporter ATP-binding protein [Hyphomicrobiaceae bacterium]